MINELSKLSEAINNANITPQEWHKDYKPIPKSAPCIRIVLNAGEVESISYVRKELASHLRKFGSNQGSFPCMNLAPLYKIDDEDIIKKIRELIKKYGNIKSASEKGLNELNIDVEEIKTWCTLNNWDDNNFKIKYNTSMNKTTESLNNLCLSYQPIETLMKESDYFSEPSSLHSKLEKLAFDMLKRKEEIALALRVLFFCSTGKKKKETNYGSLSVALESSELIKNGTPAVSNKFVEGFNDALLKADKNNLIVNQGKAIDAFGYSYKPLGEKMPKVQLFGFEACLRTMFEGQPCQSRYGQFEENSYPISYELRTKFAAALEWIAKKEHENKYWMTIADKMILFAYVESFPEIDTSCLDIFNSSNQNEDDFQACTERFFSSIRKGKKEGTDSIADGIRLFILRRIDSARTKVVYTRQTNAYELEKNCEAWTIGCSNIPLFPFGQSDVPFPLDVADIFNTFWKQDGELLTEKFKPVPRYYGLELLMEPNLSTISDLHILSEKAKVIAMLLGRLQTVPGNYRQPIWIKVEKMLALMGLLLYRKGIRKDTYMEKLPYLYGQLLKASDELHALYCKVVRNGDFPPQLIGGSMFTAATEAPIKTLHLLAQRLMPYYNWAKVYRYKGVKDEGKESWRAGWLYSLFENNANKLQTCWTPETSLNDEEKVQLFIGYLAKFPKREEASDDLKSEETEEENNNERNN
ncbi:MAG: hypothetical protein GX337_00900 [Christensenellaceae bacterium]|nr:hypothetical protein [Christensenellaceae bacterium]